MCGVSAQEPLGARDAPTACLSHSRYVQHVSGPVGAAPDGWVPSLAAVVSTLLQKLSEEKEVALFALQLHRYDHISFEYCVFCNFLTDLSQYYCYDTVCT